MWTRQGATGSVEPIYSSSRLLSTGVTSLTSDLLLTHAWKRHLMVHMLQLSNNPRGKWLVEKGPKHLCTGAISTVTWLLPPLDRDPGALCLGCLQGCRVRCATRKAGARAVLNTASCSSECSFLMKSPLRLFSHGFLIFFFFIAKCCLLLLLVRGQTRTLSLSVRVHVNFSCLQRKREGEAGMRNYNHQLNTMCAPEIPEKSICASCSFSCLQLPSVKY